MKKIISQVIFHQCDYFYSQSSGALSGNCYMHYALLPVLTFQSGSHRQNHALTIPNKAASLLSLPSPDKAYFNFQSNTSSTISSLTSSNTYDLCKQGELLISPFREEDPNVQSSLKLSSLSEANKNLYVVCRVLLNKKQCPFQ